MVVLLLSLWFNIVNVKASRLVWSVVYVWMHACSSHLDLNQKANVVPNQKRGLVNPLCNNASKTPPRSGRHLRSTGTEARKNKLNIAVELPYGIASVCRQFRSAGSWFVIKNRTRPNTPPSSVPPQAFLLSKSLSGLCSVGTSKSPLRKFEPISVLKLNASGPTKPLSAARQPCLVCSAWLC